VLAVCCDDDCDPGTFSWLRVRIVSIVYANNRAG